MASTTEQHGLGEVVPGRMVHVRAIHDLITHYAERNRMLFRGLEELYEHIRDFRVWAVEGETVLGCCALEVVWRDLAEIKSLAVASACRSAGIGRALVVDAVAEASRLGLREVFALTYEPDFFRKLGFREVAKQALPHKVWTDCIRCPLQSDCREVPMVLAVSEGKVAGACQ